MKWTDASTLSSVPRGIRPEAAPAEGFAWKAGKAEAQGYYVFALPKQ